MKKKKRIKVKKPISKKNKVKIIKKKTQKGNKSLLKKNLKKTKFIKKKITNYKKTKKVKINLKKNKIKKINKKFKSNIKNNKVKKKNKTKLVKKIKVQKSIYEKKIKPIIEKAKNLFFDFFGLKTFAIKKIETIKEILKKRKIAKQKLKEKLLIKLAKEKKKQQIIEQKLKKRQTILEKKRRIQEKKELKKIQLKQRREKEKLRIRNQKEKEKIKLAALRQKEKEFKIKQKQKLLEEKIALRKKINEEKIAERQRKEKLQNYKKEEKEKIKLLKESLQAVVVRLGFIKDKYQLIKDKKKEEKLKELESRRLAKIEARKIFEAEKAEEALKQKVVDRLERYSRNMKSIVFQINKRYLTLRRAPLRFVDRIAENGECYIKNEDAVNEEEYLILLFIDGENAKQRLRRKISLEDKTDPNETKLFRPKNVFDASDYMIDRLARMFEKERQLKKAS